METHTTHTQEKGRNDNIGITNIGIKNISIKKDIRDII